MKRFLSIILIINILFNFLLTGANASSDKGYFVVTAYYSPLPDQENYLTWDYELEKILNWEWIRWASWKEVFSWMLAAPKNYKFWTKIYLEWLWIWEVSDRGWAIVNAGKRWYEYDRIDVWMWYGDEWLRRALYWWKRKVKWNFVSNDSEVSLDYKTVASPEWATSKLKKVAKNIKKQEVDIFNKALSSKQEIEKLQDLLIQMKLYSWEITWDYNDLIDSIYSFQLNNDIVKSEYSPWAWTYWPKTRLALKNAYNIFLQKQEEEKLELARIEEERKKEELRVKELLLQYKKFEELSFKKADDKLDFIWTPKFWEISHSVRELQIILKELGYFEYNDTAIYWNITKQSIIAYQIDKNIISSENDLWAWILWPNTRESLKNDLKQIFLDEIVDAEEFNLDDLVYIINNKI